MLTPRLLAGLLTALLAFSTMPAYAEVGSAGALTLSVDRLFGLALGEREREDRRDGDLREDDYTVFGLGWTDPASPILIPRFAVDYFIIDGLSIGGSFGFYVADRDEFDNGDLRDNDDGSGILIHFRVGYAIMFADWAGIWPRGGLTYYTQDFDNNRGGWDDEDQIALSLEAPFVLSPSEHLAFLIGPAIDFGLGGDHNNNDDLREWWFGLHIGFLGWIDL